MKKNYIKKIALIIVFLILSSKCYSWCIITPPVDATYFKIIEEIVHGIKTKIPNAVSYRSNESLPIQCHEPFTGGIILLGPEPYQRFKDQLTSSTINIAVAVDADKNPIINHWFTYTPSPMEMFEKIRTIEPKLKKIHIATDQNLNVHYTDNLKKALFFHDIKLVNHSILEPKLASKKFIHIIKTMDKEKDALWISPYHSSLAINALLPTIIKQSLRYKKMTIANNLSWIDKGVYLGVYPDNFNLGVTIGTTALHAIEQAPPVQSQEKVEPQIHFLSSLKITANKKTIRFINKKLNRKVINTIDLLLPKK